MNGTEDFVIDIDGLLLDAIALARRAGAVQMHYFRGSNLDISAKRGEADVVTAADKAAEKVIIDGIRECYPDHEILSEESGEMLTGSDYCWVIDPLDGTTNFSNGLPLFSVSIAVRYRGRTVVGVVYAPRLDELFHAVAGQGAYLNGERIHASAKTRIDRAVVATGFPVDKAVNPDNNLDRVAVVMPLVRGLRRLGSAAVDLCYVAAGFLDAYWEIDLHEWDVAAGELIATEAGACATRYRNDRGVCLLASNSALHHEMLSLLTRC